MFPFVHKRVKLIAAIGSILLLQSCATYNKRIQAYHSSLGSGNFVKANEQLDNISFLQKGRNRILYLLEKGKTTHLLGLYDSSNKYFNEADLLMEDNKGSTKDLIVTGFINPMLQKYQPEDFERFMVHYYKALNYIFIGDTEAALVEARRITLVSNRQEDKFGTTKNRYSNDAFSMILQGMIYEKGNDINNAFIAYRNAADMYISNNNSYYGVNIPNQLKKDVLRTAHEMGFDDEQLRYERIFNQPYVRENKTIGGEVIIFWESGMAPVKAQQTFEFNVVGNGGSFYFRDNGGLYNIPFDNTVAGYNQQLNPGQLQMFAVALPKYIELKPAYHLAMVNAPGGNFSFEKAQDINAVAVQTLQQRFGKELATALSRMAIKKLTELAVTPSQTEEKKYKTEEERKKARRQKEVQEILALGLKIFNRATEQADTRNWQSLPNSIFYSRIPLESGINTCTITFQNSSGQSEKKILVFEGTGGLQFGTVHSMR